LRRLRGGLVVRDGGNNRWLLIGPVAAGDADADCLLRRLLLPAVFDAGLNANIESRICFSRSKSLALPPVSG